MEVVPGPAGEPICRDGYIKLASLDSLLSFVRSRHRSLCPEHTFATQPSADFGLSLQASNLNRFCHAPTGQTQQFAIDD